MAQSGSREHRWFRHLGDHRRREESLDDDSRAELGDVMAKATADRSSDILMVVCPHCNHKHEFPDGSSMDIFICEGCEELIEVVEPTN